MASQERVPMYRREWYYIEKCKKTMDNVWRENFDQCRVKKARKWKIGLDDYYTKTKKFCCFHNETSECETSILENCDKNVGQHHKDESEYIFRQSCSHFEQCDSSFLVLYTTIISVLTIMAICLCGWCWLRPRGMMQNLIAKKNEAAIADLAKNNAESLVLGRTAAEQAPVTPLISQTKSPVATVSGKQTTPQHDLKKIQLKMKNGEMTLQDGFLRLLNITGKSKDLSRFLIQKARHSSDLLFEKYKPMIKEFVDSDRPDLWYKYYAKILSDSVVSTKSFKIGSSFPTKSSIQNARLTDMIGKWRRHKLSDKDAFVQLLKWASEENKIPPEFMDFFKVGLIKGELPKKYQHKLKIAMLSPENLKNFVKEVVDSESERIARFFLRTPEEGMELTPKLMANSISIKFKLGEISSKEGFNMLIDSILQNMEGRYADRNENVKMYIRNIERRKNNGRLFGKYESDFKEFLKDKISSKQLIKIILDREYSKVKLNDSGGFLSYLNNNTDNFVQEYLSRI